MSEQGGTHTGDTSFRDVYLDTGQQWTTVYEIDRGYLIAP